MYRYLADSGYVDKKPKEAEECVKNEELNLKITKTVTKYNEIISRLQQRFRNEARYTFTENKIALISNDDKRLHYIHIIWVLGGLVKQNWQNTQKWKSD